MIHILLVDEDRETAATSDEDESDEGDLTTSTDVESAFGRTFYTNDSIFF